MLIQGKDFLMIYVRWDFCLAMEHLKTHENSSLFYEEVFHCTNLSFLMFRIDSTTCREFALHETEWQSRWHPEHCHERILCTESMLRYFSSLKTNQIRLHYNSMSAKIVSIQMVVTTPKQDFFPSENHRGPGTLECPYFCLISSLVCCFQDDSSQLYLGSHRRFKSISSYYENSTGYYPSTLKMY